MPENDATLVATPSLPLVLQAAYRCYHCILYQRNLFICKGVKSYGAGTITRSLDSVLPMHHNPLILRFLFTKEIFWLAEGGTYD